MDTNVLVSAFATRGLCADVLRAVRAEHELLASEVLVTEFRSVLEDKLGAARAVVDSAVQFIRRHHVEPMPQHPYPLEIGGADDDWVVASAVNARADVFVTGDRALLDAFDEVEGIRVLSAREFWELLAGQPRFRGGS